MDYKKRIKEWCDEICTITGWDFDEMEKLAKQEGKRSITVSENLMKATMKAINELDTNYDRCLVNLYENIFTSSGYSIGWNGLTNAINYDSYRGKGHSDRLLIINHIAKLVEIYDHWKENIYGNIIDDIKAQCKLKDDFNIDPKVLMAINGLVTKGTFKAYKYVDTGEVLNFDDGYRICSKVGMSLDLTLWFDHLKLQEEYMEAQSKDMVFVTMFGHLESLHEIFSNWVFTIHKGGTIWIVTDQFNFNNPRQMDQRLGRQSIWRTYSEKYYDCDLPYRLFHDLPGIRNLQTGLSTSSDTIVYEYDRAEIDVDTIRSGCERDKESIRMGVIDCLSTHKIKYTSVDVKNENGMGSHFFKLAAVEIKNDGHIIGYADNSTVSIYSKPEILFVDIWKDFHDNEKVFTLFLVDEFIKYYSAVDDLPNAMLATEMVQQKLLDGEQFNPGDHDNTKMEYWEPVHQERYGEFHDVLSEIDEDNKALVPVSYELAMPSKNFNASWLATPHQLESLSEWIILDAKREEIQKEIIKFAGDRKDGQKWMAKICAERYELIKSRISLSKHMDVVIPSHDHHFGLNSMYKNGIKIVRVRETIFRTKKAAKDDYRMAGIGKSWGEMECIADGCTTYHRMKPLRDISIYNADGLVWLLGLESKEELHPYFRLFASHAHRPYNGNSLLTQTHPYNSLYDPCSRKYTNGMHMTFFMCGTCNTRWKMENDADVTIRVGRGKPNGEFTMDISEKLTIMERFEEGKYWSNILANL